MQIMVLVERYINDRPGNENEVKISNGWWDKFTKRNLSLYLRNCWRWNECENILGFTDYRDARNAIRAMST